MKRFVFGLFIGLFLAAITVAAQSDPQVIQFTPYADVLTYPAQSTADTPLRQLKAGQTVTLYTPLVGGDARWWAAVGLDRKEWVAIAVNGYCPREKLGNVEGELPR